MGRWSSVFRRLGAQPQAIALGCLSTFTPYLERTWDSLMFYIEGLGLGMGLYPATV